jgi:hypothetical protein
LCRCIGLSRDSTDAVVIRSARVMRSLAVAIAILLLPAIAAAGKKTPPPPPPPPDPAPEQPSPSDTKSADDSGPSDAAGAPAVPPAERVGVGSAAPAQPPPEPVAPAPGFHWEPFGYLRVQYIAVQDDPNVAFVGRDDGFEIQNARAGVRGNLSNRASFVLSVDGAIDERNQVNSPQGNLAIGLRDAYTDIAIGGPPQAQLVARVGYFVPWADPEVLVPDTSREFIDKPIEDRGIPATQGYQTPGLTPGHAIGAAIRLDPEVPTSGVRAGFELAVQNGADEFSSNNDNDYPAVSAAGILRFPHDGWLLAAVRYNPRTIGDLPFRQDEDDLQGAFGLRVAFGPVDVMGGLFFDQTTFPTTGGPTQNEYGGHAQVMFRLADLPHPFAIGYRFDVIDPSSLVTTDQVMEHTVGAVLGVPSLRMRFQLQVVVPIEQEQRALSNDRVQLAAEVAL